MAPKEGWMAPCDCHRVVANTRQYTDGQKGDGSSRPSFLTRVVALATMGIYVGWFHVLLGMLVASFYNQWAAVAFAAMCLTAFMPMRTWPGLLGTWMFSKWRQYHQFSYLFEENLSPYNSYIMAQFPHGACPIATILAGSSIQTFWPEFNAHCLAASFIFSVPGWRQMHSWMYTYPATRGMLMKLLTGRVENHSIWADRHGNPLPDCHHARHTTKSAPLATTSSSRSSSSDEDVTAVVSSLDDEAAPPAPTPHPLSGHLRHLPVVSDQPIHSTVGRKLGVMVGILVGGIAELFLADPDVEHIVVSKRKGFVRAAVETGTYLLPTYYFGQSVMLKFGPRWLRNLSRKLRTTFGCLYGPFGLPVPYQIPIMMVCARPMPVKQMSPEDPGFEAYVDEVHAKFVKELERTFETHKVAYGWADRKLVIH